MKTEPVTEGIKTLIELQTPGFIIAQKGYSSAIQIPKHEHQSVVASIPLRGSFVESNSFSSYLCQRHGLSINPAGEHHASRFGEGTSSCLVISSTGDNTPLNEWTARSFAEPIYVRDSRLSALALHVIRELQEPDAISAVLIEGFILEMMGFAARGAGRTRDTRIPKWLVRVRDYLDANIDHVQPLQQLAELGGVHQTTLCRLFRRYYRCSVGEYIRKLRLERSAKDLSDPDLTLAEIASASGFYDQSHFTNAFRRHFGVTPTEYRRTMIPGAILEGSKVRGNEIRSQIGGVRISPSNSASNLQDS